MKRLNKGVVKGLNIEIKEKESNNNKNLTETFDAFSIENKINVDKETESMLKLLFVNYREFF